MRSARGLSANAQQMSNTGVTADESLITCPARMEMDHVGGEPEGEPGGCGWGVGGPPCVGACVWVCAWVGVCVCVEHSGRQRSSSDGDGPHGAGAEPEGEPGVCVCGCGCGCGCVCVCVVWGRSPGTRAARVGMHSAQRGGEDPDAGDLWYDPGVQDLVKWGGVTEIMGVGEGYQTTDIWGGSWQGARAQARSRSVGERAQGQCSWSGSFPCWIRRVKSRVHEPRADSGGDPGPGE